MRLLLALGSVCCWQPEVQEPSEIGASLHPIPASHSCIPAWAQVSTSILHPPSPAAGHRSWQRGGLRSVWTGWHGQSRPGHAGSARVKLLGDRTMCCSHHPLSHRTGGGWGAHPLGAQDQLWGWVSCWQWGGSSRPFGPLLHSKTICFGHLEPPDQAPEPPPRNPPPLLDSCSWSCVDAQVQLSKSHRSPGLTKALLLHDLSSAWQWGAQHGDPKTSPSPAVPCTAPAGAARQLCCTRGRAGFVLLSLHSER